MEKTGEYFAEGLVDGLVEDCDCNFNLITHEEKGIKNGEKNSRSKIRIL